MAVKLEFKEHTHQETWGEGRRGRKKWKQKQKETDTEKETERQRGRRREEKREGRRDEGRTYDTGHHNVLAVGHLMCSNLV